LSYFVFGCFGVFNNAQKDIPIRAINAIGRTIIPTTDKNMIARILNTNSIITLITIPRI
jgi:hypothetical protein